MNNEINELLIKLDTRMDRQENMLQQLVNIVAKNNGRFNELDKRFDHVDQRLNDMDKRFDTVDQRLESIESAVTRTEQNEPADIMAMLKQMNGKLDERDFELQALNKRVFKTESEIERLTRQ